MCFQIKDVIKENLDSFIKLCIPSDKIKDRLFIKGIKKKKIWAEKILKKYGNFAKVAYKDDKPVGFIQYILKEEEKIVEIRCIFIPEKENLRKGIGKKLLFSLIDDVITKNSISSGMLFNALINYPIDIPNWFKESEFFKKYGFKEILLDGLSCLYYPLKENYIYKPKEEAYIPLDEDKGKALIFYDPACPFSIYFSESIEKIIKNINASIKIRHINLFEESIEISKRGKFYNVIVNKIPIKSFFLDKENFEKEVKEALKK